MGLLHAMEEGASNLLRPTGHASCVWLVERTEKGLRAVVFFGGEGVRRNLMYLIEFQAYPSFMSGREKKKTKHKTLKRVHVQVVSD